MGEKTKIEWRDHTFNPWRGCTKVAAGCANCYADRQARGNPGTLGIWGDDGTRVLASESMWREPIKWNKAAVSDQINHEDETHLGKDLGAYIRPRVFCASLADVFEDWPGQVSVKISDKSHFSKGMSEPITLNDVRLRLFGLIDATPHLDWLLLTKRPENIRRMWPCANDNDGDGDCWVCAKGGVSCKQRRSNVWLGTSVATQEDADKNIPELLKCRDLSPVLFVSAEPLLGPVDVRRWTSVGLQCSACEWSGCEDSRNVQKPFSGESSDYEFTCPECDGPCGHTPMDECIDWLIAGGESGPKARPMHPAWARSLRDQCQAAGVPFFFKQWGEWLPHSQVQYSGAHYSVSRHKFDDDNLASRVGKAAAGRLLDGREWNEFPRVDGGDA